MALPELHNERQLIHFLALGGEDAFTKIFDHYSDKLYSTALYYLKSPEGAEEVVQDVFLKIWLKRTTLPDIDNFGSYIFIVTRNIIFDRMKKKAHEQAFLRHLHDRPSFVSDTDKGIIQWQYDQLLQEAIEQLPPRQKKLFLLAKEKGWSHDAIAQKLGISRLTVKKHIARALKSVRRYLQHNMKNLLLPLIFTSLVLF